jgi:hypothetical protein
MTKKPTIIERLIRRYRQTGEQRYLSRALFTDYLMGLPLRRRGRPLKPFTADERALFAQMEARMKLGATEYEAARLALGIVAAPAGDYPQQVRAVVERYRDWREWCRRSGQDRI